MEYGAYTFEMHTGWLRALDVLIVFAVVFLVLGLYFVGSTTLHLFDMESFWPTAALLVSILLSISFLDILMMKTWNSQGKFNNNIVKNTVKCPSCRASMKEAVFMFGGRGFPDRFYLECSNCRKVFVLNRKGGNNFVLQDAN